MKKTTTISVQKKYIKRKRGIGHAIQKKKRRGGGRKKKLKIKMIKKKEEEERKKSQRLDCFSFYSIVIV